MCNFRYNENTKKNNRHVNELTFQLQIVYVRVGSGTGVITAIYYLVRLITFILFNASSLAPTLLGSKTCSSEKVTHAYKFNIQLYSLKLGIQLF